ncbi:MAG: thiamine pyrophosphate-binding protein [bacterium]|nr:thiamine pyrophosphate-binding protein [bacterium]
MKVADFVINYLADYGIKEMFVVYGAANGDLIDAFTRTDKTRYIAVMHEQAGGFAAEVYAKVSGKPGVAIATSGPGGMNFVTPIGNFFYDSVPGLFITGQINSRFLRPDPTIRQVGFQETDIISIVRPITKYAVMITDPESIKYELEKALFLAQDGRPGPVLLDMPLNIQKQEIDPDKLIGFDPETEKTGYSLDAIDEKIDRFLEDLKKAKRPSLMIGGGVRIAGAVEKLLEIGRKLKIPMYPTWNALDIITSDYEYYGGRIGTYGGRGRNFGLQNSDLVLAVGSRISGRITGGNLSSFLREAKKYVVDVDITLLQKKLQQVPFDVSIHADAKLFLDRLSKKLETYSVPDFHEWTTKVIGWKDKYDPVKPEYFEQKEYVNPYAFFRVLSEAMSKDDILVGDCGGNIVVSNHAFETKQGQRNITNNGNSPMGFSFAGAMGAWFASDKKQNVVCTIGDGGMNMNIQELQTFINYGIKVKTFIVNNHIYGITKAFQETNFEGRMEACGPKGYNPPDFVKVANAYGIKTVTISNNSELKEKIKEVLDYDGPIICDVNCHEWHTYEPRIFGWKTPIEDMYPYLPREEFKANMFIQPLEGWESPEMPGGAKFVDKKPVTDP